MTHPRNLPRQRGFGLIEGLIALFILSVGILGLVRFQARMLAQTTDSQTRLVATSLTEELLAQVRVDAANAACYTVPQQGTCGNAFSLAQAQAWADRARQAGFKTARVTASAANRVTATLTWDGKAFEELRTHEVTTDARP